MPVHVFLVAGEPSGDVLGASLMAALKAETGGDVRFTGIGGPAMAARGLPSLVPMAELAVMGVIEILPSLRRILRRVDETVVAIRTARPDVVVTIDSQSFSYQIAKRLRPSPCPMVQYVGPTVWAWKPWRARHLAEVVDRVLLLFPFESPYWDAVGLDSVFVGHPATELSVDEAMRIALREEALGGRRGPLLAILPGSRRGVVRRHLPIFRDAALRLGERHPGLAVVLPTVDMVAGEVGALAADWAVPATVIAGGTGERLAAMAAADVALATSGTVALELAAAGTPHVIAYRANPLTAMIVRRMIRVDRVSPVNLVAGRDVTPELIQQLCTPDKLAQALHALINDDATATRQRAGLADVLAVLGKGGEAPSRRAARAVLEMVGRNRRP